MTEHPPTPHNSPTPHTPPTPTPPASSPPPTSDTTPAPTPASAPDKPARPLKKWLIRGGAIAAGVLLLLLLIAPTIISMGIAEGIVSSSGSDAIPGSIKVDNISVGWFSGATIEGMTISDPNGDPVVSFTSLTAPNAALLRLARGSKDLGEISLNGLRINVEQYEDGSTNLDKTFIAPGDTDEKTPAPTPESDDDAEPASIPESLHALFKLPDALVTVKAPGTEPILVKLAVDAKVDGRQLIAAQLKTAIEQGVQAGKINFDLNVTNYADADGLLTLMAANVDLNAGIDALEMAVVDRLIGQDGLLRELIGAQLNASIKASGTVAQIDSDITVKSQHLNMSGGIVFKDSALTEKPDTAIRFHLTPQAMAKLMASKPDPQADQTAQSAEPVEPALRLLEPVDMTIGINNIHLATDENHVPQFGSAQIDLLIQSTDIALQPVADNLASHIKSLKVTAVSSPLSQGLVVDAGFTLERDSRTSDVTFNAKLANLIDDTQAIAPMQATADIGFAVNNLDLATVEKLTSQVGVIVPVLGPQLNTTGSLIISPASADAAVDARTITGQLNLTTEQMQVAGTIDGAMDSQALTFGTGTQLTLTVQPGLIDAVTSPTSPDSSSTDSASAENPDASDATAQPATVAAIPPGIIEPLVLTFAIDQVHAPLNGEGDTFAIARLTANDILLKGDGLEDMSVRDLALVIDRFSLTGESNMALNAKLFHGQNNADMTGTVKVANLSGGDQPLTSHVDLTLPEIPVAILDALGNQNGTLLAMLGEKLDTARVTLDATVDHQKEDGVNAKFAAVVNSPNLNVDLSGEANPATHLTVKPNSTVRLNLVPALVEQLTASPAIAADEEAGIEAVEAKPGLAMAQSAEAVITFKSLVVGMTKDKKTGSAKPDPTQIASQINFALGDVDIVEPASQQSFNVRGVNFDIVADDLTRDIKITGQADLNQGSGESAMTGTLRTTTTAKGLIDGEFQPQLEQANVSSETQINVPVGILDSLLGQQQRLITALGDTIVGKITASLNPGKPDELSVDVNTPTDVKFVLNASRQSDDEPFTWELDSSAAPVISEMKAIGNFDLTDMILNIDKFQAITLYTSRQDLGVLNILTPEQIQMLEDYRIAIGGKIQMKEISVPLTDPKASTARIRLTIDSANAYYHEQRIPIGTSYIDISMADNIFTLNRANLKVVGGNISLSGKTDLADPDLRSKYTLSMRDLNVRSAAALFTEPKSLESRVAGTVEGEINIQAPLMKITEATRGDGHLKLKEAILTPLPVVSDVMQFLSLTEKLSALGVNFNDLNEIPNSGNDAALFKFEFLDDRIKFTSIDLETEVANVRGSGEDIVTFDQTADMNLKIELIGGWLGRQIDVPGFVKSAVAKKLSVSGPLDSLTIK